jgi:DNA repair protein RecN (Recombination protein N)
MLKSLSIRNYALIEELDVEFTSGLNIITGETGSGKSIIIDALGLILGDRANTDVVRKGRERTIVEAVFAISGNRKLLRMLEGHGLESSDELIVRREVSAKGQSRCFISDSPVTLALQREAGEYLVDLHGQHEHQSLLRRDTHVALIDDFGGLESLVEEFRKARTRMRDVCQELNDLRAREKVLAEKRDFYQFQMREIDAIAPRAGEEEELEAELRILENAERLFAATGSLYGILYDGEQSIHDQLVIVRNQLQDLKEIDRGFTEAADECASAEVIVSELAKFIQSYNARVEFNPERLETLRDRLGKISLLRRKYGGSLEAVLAHRETIAKEVTLAENFDTVMARLEDELEQLRSACAMLAQQLSAKRHDVARKVDKAVVAELTKLGIAHAQFATRIEREEITGTSDDDDYVMGGGVKLRLMPSGYDKVEFFLSTNMGEEPQQLVTVASGGEISRIMLALKSILAKSDRLPVLIFDEIDVGVSGRIALAVGQSLKNLSAFHQVLAITHLPQIAGLADAHFVVEKSEHGGRTTTSMRRLSLEEQVEEVARLMSGSVVTSAGLEGARELMKLRSPA